MVYELKRSTQVKRLFGGWQETMVWSCLQGVMGRLYGDDPERPSSAVAVLGDFSFFAGKPSAELVAFLPEKTGGKTHILVPQTAEWSECMRSVYGDRMQAATRYALQKWPLQFDRQALQTAVAGLAAGYELRLMDQELFDCCKQIPWCEAWVAQYEDFSQYQRYGLGVVGSRDGEIVAGASSYSGFLKGIEIQIDTREEDRRKGLAYACGAKLILTCLERGWIPSWDAHNEISASLAQKLGFRFSHTYSVFEIPWTCREQFLAEVEDR